MKRGIAWFRFPHTGTPILFGAGVEPSPMADIDTDEAVKRFLRKADDVYEEYEQGYADADATLRRLERHLEDLRDAAEA
jgi:glutaredoxin 2